MTQIPGQTGWFKTERPAPSIVSYAKDLEGTPANKIACSYAETLANHKYNGHSILMSKREIASFVVDQVHAYMATTGEDGIIVHNTHKGSRISYITFLVGDWSSLQGQLDHILLQYHQKYQSVFPTASQSFKPAVTTSALSASAVTSSTSVPFSLPTQGVHMPVTELVELPFDQIRSGWDKFDQRFKMEITRDALWKWACVWKDDQKYKPIFEELFRRFITSLPKHHKESGHYEDLQISQHEFFENCARDLRVGALDRQPIALPMFLMKYWNLLEPPAQQEQADDEYGFVQRAQREQSDLRAKVVVAILTLGQRDDLGPLKGLYVTPLLQGVYGEISTMSLDALFDAYRGFADDVVGRYGNSSAINRGYLSALQKSFMDLLSRCSKRMDQSTREHQDLWNRAAQVAGEQANLQFLTQYGSKFELDVFANCVPLSLAPDVWQSLPERQRQRLFIDAACSDEHIDFVKSYMNDKAIDEHTKSLAYSIASEPSVNPSAATCAASSSNSTEEKKAPKIAVLLKHWAPSQSETDEEEEEVG